MIHLYHVGAPDSDDPIHIFGAGRGGEALFEALLAAGYRVASFVDTEKTGAFAGLPIIPTADFVRAADRNSRILLASQHWPEAADTLAAFGFTDVRNAYPVICQRLGIPDSTWKRRWRARLLAGGIVGGLAASYGLVVAVRIAAGF
ncbi:hypothetical protein D3877_28820 [Azospirillum cavernae]|uniref:Uncharacterized protein n=1 Tax=Azospirillum cavernae TaxID=2320860 RepID=A0A418VL53_9PROT|nr:hypothetical protein [Azospirillum cavernae]RJF76883.1 hypothetical protein D3877_28820 [Azospirillum cavernae]